MPLMSRTGTTLAAIAALVIGVPPAQADGSASVQSSCGARTKGPYGFQCTGFATVNPAKGLEPVTFLGSVEGSNAGVFRGTGFFNSSLGAAKQRVIGTAQFSDRSCAGFIKYDVFLILPGNVEVPLPPLEINFVTVDGGKEVLGAPTANGASGDAVPRMACRLVKTQGSD